jgi:hypothetical protein
MASAIPMSPSAAAPAPPTGAASVAHRGILRVVTNQEMASAQKAQQQLAAAPEEVLSGVVSHIRRRFEQAVRHREKTGVDKAMLDSLRAYNGEYTPEKKQMIAQFGGSDIYARITAQKCRGATALLRDIYLSADEAWSLSASPVPTLPESVMKDIMTLIGTENMAMAQAGQPVDPTQLLARKEQLIAAAMAAERRRADRQAKESKRQLEDILLEGRFYEALSAFLADLPVYKIAVIKGPVVRRTTKVRWQDGKPVQTEELGFFWERVSPFDFWTTPGATDMRKTETFERLQFTTQELYDLIEVPGFDGPSIRRVIEKYETAGFQDWTATFRRERDRLEGRDTSAAEDGFIDGIEYNGYILGKHLKEIGLKGIEDDLKPYFVTAWLIDKEVIKVQLNPNPRKRVPYYVSSYDKRAGSIYGDAIPQLMEDIQDVVNASLRSLVNNMGMSSGPQVAINYDMLAQGQNTAIYPWKQWGFTIDAQNPQAKGIEFFQPDSHAQELLVVYKAFSEMGDEASAIPRYMTGDNKIGGAGRTASGLQMLMNNANKSLQNVAQNVDEDVMVPVLEGLYDIVMLTDATGMLRGDEQIVVNGVRNVAKQEQDRVRQLEFLQLTANPIDAPLIGQERSRVLQSVADGLGLNVDIPEPGENPTPTPPGTGGPSFNPAGGPAPDPSVSENGQPRLASAPQVNNVSARNNIA